MSGLEGPRATRSFLYGAWPQREEKEGKRHLNCRKENGGKKGER